jgi:hypothetical protein
MSTKNGSPPPKIGIILNRVGYMAIQQQLKLINSRLGEVIVRWLV